MRRCVCSAPRLTAVLGWCRQGCRGPRTAPRLLDVAGETDRLFLTCLRSPWPRADTVQFAVRSAQWIGCTSCALSPAGVSVGVPGAWTPPGSGRLRGFRWKSGRPVVRLPRSQLATLRVVRDMCLMLDTLSPLSQETCTCLSSGCLLGDVASLLPAHRDAADGPG